MYASLTPPRETTTYGCGGGFLPCNNVEDPIKQPFTMLGHNCMGDTLMSRTHI